MKIKEWLTLKQNIIIISTLLAIPIFLLFGLFFSVMGNTVSGDIASTIYQFIVSLFMVSMATVFVIGAILNKLKWKILINIILLLLTIGAILSFLVGNFDKSNFGYPVIIMDIYIMSYWIVNFSNNIFNKLKKYIKDEKLSVKDLLSISNKIIIGIITIVSSILGTLLVLKQLLS